MARFNPSKIKNMETNDEKKARVTFEQPEKKGYYEKCDKKCEGYPNADCACSYGDFEQNPFDLEKLADQEVYKEYPPTRK